MHLQARPHVQSKSVVQKLSKLEVQESSRFREEEEEAYDVATQEGVGECTRQAADLMETINRLIYRFESVSSPILTRATRRGIGGGICEYPGQQQNCRIR